MEKNVLRKGLVIGIIFLFVGVSVVPSIGGTIVKRQISQDNKTSFMGFNPYGNILYVGGSGPNNYTQIQDAIDTASDEDTVFVYNGIYYENLVIDKSITLIGENKSNTIIDGSRIDDTVHVDSENVTISGFTICNSSREKYKWYIAGVRLTGSNNIIYDNIIKDNMLGIFGKKVTNTTIFDNQFFGDGIIFSLYDNEEEPVPYLNKYFVHNIYDNEVNNKTLYYFRNQDDIEVPIDAGQIIGVNCNKLTIRDANLDNADFGCILVNCSDCVIEYSSISYSDGMLWLIHSMKNLIQKNKIAHNFEGICLDSGSRRNIIQYNNISYNEVFGIIIEDGSNFNKISRNNFIKNCLEIPLGQAYFTFCFYNRWKKNYWDRPRILPKVIQGEIGNIAPWINFDFRPAKKPYDIPQVAI